MNSVKPRITHSSVAGLRRRVPRFINYCSSLKSFKTMSPGLASQFQSSASVTSPRRRRGRGGPAQSRAPRVTWAPAPPGPSPSPTDAAAPAVAAPARSRPRSAARSAVKAARIARGRRMALRGLAHSGPNSRGPSEEVVAAAEERRAPAVVPVGAVREDDEEDDGRGRGLLRWDGFSAWLHCVCVVGFDLELGQAVEVRPGRSVVPAPSPGPSTGVAPAERVARRAGRPGLRPLRIRAWPAAPPPLCLGSDPSAVPVGGSWAAARGEKFSQGPS